MFNLLPQQEQRALSREYRLRLGATALFMLASLAILSLVALAPSLVLSLQKESLVSAQDKALKARLALHGDGDSSGVLKIAEKKAKALQATIYTPYAYELVDAAFSVAPASVKLYGFFIKRADAEYDVIVSGHAKNRDSLLAFAHALETQKMFSNVTLPVSNFAAASDLDFSLNLSAPIQAGLP